MIGSKETVLEARDLSYKYPNGTVAIEDINLKINRGEKVAIIGSNGAGKSTLLSHFNGLKEPATGDILIESSAKSGCCISKFHKSAVCTYSNRRCGFRANESGSFKRGSG